MLSGKAPLTALLQRVQVCSAPQLPGMLQPCRCVLQACASMRARLRIDLHRHLAKPCA